LKGTGSISGLQKKIGLHGTTRENRVSIKDSVIPVKQKKYLLLTELVQRINNIEIILECSDLGGYVTGRQGGSYK